MAKLLKGGLGRIVVVVQIKELIKEQEQKLLTQMTAGCLVYTGPDLLLQINIELFPQSSFIWLESRNWEGL